MLFGSSSSSVLVHRCCGSSAGRLIFGVVFCPLCGVAAAGDSRRPATLCPVARRQHQSGLPSRARRLHGRPQSRSPFRCSTRLSRCCRWTALLPWPLHSRRPPIEMKLSCTSCRPPLDSVASRHQRWPRRSSVLPLSTDAALMHLHLWPPLFCISWTALLG